MTLRQRKRGGAHFALTCNGDGCKAEFRAKFNGISSYTLRAEAVEAGWSRDRASMDHDTLDYCPLHPGAFPPVVSS